ncbi:hypothetical protein [Lysinibacillus capsici]|uniref:hypothetical protein n=1 Tax=Lysinibacillus capsici TaxID=2115968 RepID=UPI0030820F1A|nr:hypothetical protein ICJ70_01525 [Lysinibacillus capsici]
MYNKLFVKMANGEENEFNGYFNVDAKEDCLLIYDVQSKEIIKWAENQIRSGSMLSYIEIEDEGMSVLGYRKFRFITEVTNGDTILIK